MGKRLVDIVAGTILSLLCLPLIAILAVCACISLRTWRPFFVQRRIGHRAHTFSMVKIRTLPPDTFPYSVKGDRPFPLAPRFAGWLRRTHLDELPQILLVPSGLMSLVGPRPKMPDSFEPVDPGYGQARVLVPQGCTGLWQIGAHTDQPPHIAPQYDFFYLEHRSLRLDLWILLTTGALMLGFGSRKELGDIPRWALRRNLTAPPVPDYATEVHT